MRGDISTGAARHKSSLAIHNLERSIAGLKPITSAELLKASRNRQHFKNGPTAGKNNKGVKYE